jgi:hypothetical protein
MKKNMRSYIEQAKNGATRKHLNFVDDPKMNFVNQPNLYANGAGAPSNGVKQSMPYAVTVTSVSASNVSNFDVLGAYEYINNAGFTAAGSLVIGSITIASAIPGVTYRDLLYQSMNNPFTVGMTYLNCSTAGQVDQVFTITTKDANGTQVIIPIVPSTDPYQQIATIQVVNQEYRMDGFTKLTFSTILANAVLTIRWFPSDNLNPARALSGQPTGRSYGNPGIIRK